MKAIGQAQQTKHIGGAHLTAGEAIKAKCYDCCGGYADGKYDCGTHECSLYPFMPYKGLYEPCQEATSHLKKKRELLKKMYKAEMDGDWPLVDTIRCALDKEEFESGQLR